MNPEKISELASVLHSRMNPNVNWDSVAYVATMFKKTESLPNTNPDVVIRRIAEYLPNNSHLGDLYEASILVTSNLIERHPEYSYLAASILADATNKEVAGCLGLPDDVVTDEAELFEHAIAFGIAVKRISPALDLQNNSIFDVAALKAAIRTDRTQAFTYLGLQTLYDRYFLQHREIRFETAQIFIMRVAMGLSINEDHPTQRAIEFYDTLSSFSYMTSTPTLFNAGTLRPQLSSCYLTTVPDDLSGIYSAIHDNAMLSKWAGGLGNDWTQVRGMGSHIEGTNGKSQGVVPFLKVANDTAVAVNQCFAPDTRIYTAEGIRSIDNIRKGSLVLGISGHYRTVLDVMKYDQKDAMVELEVEHTNEKVKVTAGHPFYALCQNDDGEQSAEWIDAGQLAEGAYIAKVIPKAIIPVLGLTDDDVCMYGLLLTSGMYTIHGVWSVVVDGTDAVFVQRYLSTKRIHHTVTSSANCVTIKWKSGEFFIEPADIYSMSPTKRISKRMAHLPLEQTRLLLKTIFDVVRELGGQVINNVYHVAGLGPDLAEDLRYQLLRVGCPAYLTFTEQHGPGTAENMFHAYSVRLCIPLTKELANLFGCEYVESPSTWFVDGNKLYTRVLSVKPVAACPVVVDLIVEGDESYMTTVALAHNGGKRKGAVCAFLETWHLDIEEFLELRKNTGDDRRRTHDMNTANWVPDLFMKRVFAKERWTLFTPAETPDLHDLYDTAFEKRYVEYERMADEGKLANFKIVEAHVLWQKMLTMLFETGHPWITFKDACNIRSPQQHVGVVHSSNLCTEITLNTSADEIAVCNLGSINLAAHVRADGTLMSEKLKRTVTTAIRMLDNVIDINYYAVEAARRSNLRHRPIGLGVMGFQDALYICKTPYASERAVELADMWQEEISYYAIEASSDLAASRGRYSTFTGSLWDKGILPIDSLRIQMQSRAPEHQTLVDYTQRLDWDTLRQKVMRQGMRNSNVMAIAPTATISNICGVAQSIEPTFRNIFVKSNLSGEFTVFNSYLVEALVDAGLWSSETAAVLKQTDGSLADINGIPDEIKALFKTSFEIEPQFLIRAGARRQKWLDQAQSFNMYLAKADGRALDNAYKMTWLAGYKTTYYLRTLGATSVERSTGNIGQLNAVPARGPACAIDNPDCEACQ